MNQTTTKEDALNLVKNAIGELYKYGLIPKSLSIEQAKTLATRNLITKTIKPHQELTDVNLFSLVVGKLKYIDFLPAIALPFIVVKKIFNIFYELLYPLIIILAWLYYFGDISGFLLSLIYFIVLGPAILIEDLIEFFIRINRPIPISLFNSVNSMNWGEYVPEGWIDSFGMLGKESWNGSLRTIIFGFTGYKIQLEDEETFFIGSSIYMEIQPKS